MATQENKHQIFKLEKWFLDAVTEEGDCFIIYAAVLAWKSWSITFSSVLKFSEDSKIYYKSKIGNIHFPKIRDSQISWGDKYLKSSGLWTSNTAAIQDRIFENQTGNLDWNCLQPRAEVSLNFKNKKYAGLGYVEKLVLTTLPWNIPMDVLRWGRFVSEKYHIVWIEYQRVQIEQWVWVNGEKVANCEISDDFISNGEKGLKLCFGKKMVLEKEKKILNVIKKLVKFLPGFKKSIPIKFLNANEKKWLNKSVLKIDDRIICEGWTIHEYVNFNED